MSLEWMERLDYLHDATVTEVVWSSVASARSLRMAVSCDEECGDPELAGKQLVVRFNNVLVCSATLWGHVAGDDALNSFSNDVTPEVREYLQRLTALGISTPKMVFRVACHSGSEVQLACDEVVIGEIGSQNC